MANLVFELEKKLPASVVTTGVQRNIERMKSVLEEAGLLILNPLGEVYNETRTDLEASISGTGKDALYIVEVIKPVIYEMGGDGSGRSMVQKGVVIAGNKQ